ncbi:hypothetical protein F5J12DRAFT_786283 [Pisolithus orientalis]|uniref:uncharacterized protein n=1 Tax=Pisolithus orientalis TaxID=936130 RepID=UPI0022256DF6|nr:uncharacterized protein F5J12DRAFT_786283 [Pisolithus orientalis]KAI5991736.1 hypothetical protein F5J12DRAFT_786283 [Pisolithus orientalis]
MHKFVVALQASIAAAMYDVVTAERLEYIDNPYLNFSSGLKRYSIRDGVETAARNRLSCSDVCVSLVMLWAAAGSARAHHSHHVSDCPKNQIDPLGLLIFLSKPAIQSTGPATWTPRLSEYECFLHDSPANAGVETIRADIPPWKSRFQGFHQDRGSR